MRTDWPAVGKMLAQHGKLVAAEDARLKAEAAAAARARTEAAQGEAETPAVTSPVGSETPFGARSLRLHPFSSTAFSNAAMGRGRSSPLLAIRGKSRFGKAPRSLISSGCRSYVQGGGVRVPR